MHVLNMCAGFASTGAQVELIARGDDMEAARIFDEFGLPHRFGLSLHPLRSGLSDKFAFVRQVRRQIACYAPGTTLAFGRSSYGLLFGLPRSVPFIYDVHSWPAARGELLIEKLLMRRSNLILVTATTRALIHEYESAYPHLRGRTMVAPNGAPAPTRHLRDLSVGGSKRLQVYYVGHLYRGRGVDLILELARREPDMDFHLVGGEDADVRHWAPQAPANMIFHGYVRPERLPEHYASADVCLAPYQASVSVAGGSGDSARWMSPLKLFEYMSHGKPIVASDMPIIREVLTPEEDALLCPPSDPHAWRRALRRLRDNPDMRRALAEASHKNSATNYSWRRRAERILERAGAELQRLTIAA